MYGYVEKANHFRLVIDRKTFKLIYKRCSYNIKTQRFIEIKLKNTQKCKRALSLENQFIRFVHNGWYMDIEIRRITEKRGYLIQLGKIIDYSKMTHIKTIK